MSAWALRNGCFNKMAHLAKAELSRPAPMTEKETALQRQCFSDASLMALGGKPSFLRGRSSRHAIAADDDRVD